MKRSTCCCFCLLGLATSQKSLAIPPLTSIPPIPFILNWLHLRRHVPAHTNVLTRTVQTISHSRTARRVLVWTPVAVASVLTATCVLLALKMRTQKRASLSREKDLLQAKTDLENRDQELLGYKQALDSAEKKRLEWVEELRSCVQDKGQEKEQPAPGETQKKTGSGSPSTTGEKESRIVVFLRRLTSEAIAGQRLMQPIPCPAETTGTSSLANATSENSGVKGKIARFNEQKSTAPVPVGQVSSVHI